MLNNTINSLKDYFSQHKGVQRPNRYSMSFVNAPNSSFKDTEYVVDEFQLNKRAIDTVSDNLNGYGIGRLIPRRQRFEQGFGVTFPVTGDNKIMLFMNDWFNLIYSGGYSVGTFNTPFRLGYYDTVVKNCQVVLNLLDLNGNTVSRFTFNEVMPVETLPIKPNSIAPDPYMRYSVVFNYRDFKHESV
jgi:hypothetical protein